jgi:hypothetical protein
VLGGVTLEEAPRGEILEESVLRGNHESFVDRACESFSFHRLYLDGTDVTSFTNSFQFSVSTLRLWSKRKCPTLAARNYGGMVSLMSCPPQVVRKSEDHNLVFVFKAEGDNLPRPKYYWIEVWGVLFTDIDHDSLLPTNVGLPVGLFFACPAKTSAVQGYSVGRFSETDF